MPNRIYRARQVHGVNDMETLRARHTAEVALKFSAGVPSVSSSTPVGVASLVSARIDGGEWLFDCVCGAGVSADPEWPEAFCFACEREYNNISWPADRVAIEDALSLRKHAKNRFWFTSETLADILAENIANGVT